MKIAKSNDELSLRKYWQEKINACDASGLKKSVYCRKNNLKYDHMMYWQTELF